VSINLTYNNNVILFSIVYIAIAINFIKIEALFTHDTKLTR